MRLEWRMRALAVFVELTSGGAQNSSVIVEDELVVCCRSA